MLSLPWLYKLNVTSSLARASCESQVMAFIIVRSSITINYLFLSTKVEIFNCINACHYL